MVLKTLRRSKKKLLALDNVIGVGVGYKEVSNRRTDDVAVLVFVREKKARRDLEKDQVVPRKIGSVATDVIEIGEVRFLQRTEKARPAQPGMSIGHYAVSAGTFGAVVKDKHTKEVLILSNNHVLANATSGSDGRAKIGDPVFQPGPYDGGSKEDVIGYLERFTPVVPMVTEAECPVAAAATVAANAAVRIIRPGYRVRLEKETRRENLVDAAVARPVRPNLIRPEILELGEVKGTAKAELGMVVRKSGRTTGVTEGIVKALHVNLKVNMGNDVYAMFDDQVITSMDSAGGDSGSLVLDKNNQAVGLLFAGSDRFTVFNHLDHVMNALNIEF
ncbi:hypothetical protein [Calderihabitans maritimus]|uniref:Peptidase S7 domain-containing protein n=1 Tax=Calderihabitans maritimus TaxID=1246530 RepID=A0A1Z5HQ28_9FIRM|nr:hypothetical protein [Calderihabitans maritimus]GAW91633.1 hypothetical protein Desca_0068 [Calderihabitans maritimus]